MKKILRGLLLAAMALIALTACDKNNPQPSGGTSSGGGTNDWYILNHYSEIPDGMGGYIVNPNVGVTGPDKLLDFRADGTVWFRISSVPTAEPAYWGDHGTNPAGVKFITQGAGSQAYIYLLINETSTTRYYTYDTGIGLVYYFNIKKV